MSSRPAEARAADEMHHYCAVCQHPLDQCSHCDAPAPLLPVPEEEIERLARIASDAFGFGEVMRWSNWHAVVRAVLAGAAQHEEGPLPATPPEGT